MYFHLLGFYIGTIVDDDAMWIIMAQFSAPSIQLYIEQIRKQCTPFPGKGS